MSCLVKSPSSPQTSCSIYAFPFPLPLTKGRENFCVFSSTFKAFCCFNTLSYCSSFAAAISSPDTGIKTFVQSFKSSVIPFTADPISSKSTS